MSLTSQAALVWALSYIQYYSSVCWLVLAVFKFAVDALNIGLYDSALYGDDGWWQFSNSQKN